MTTTTNTTDIAGRYREVLEAIGRQDLDAAISHYHPDVKVRDHAQGRSLTGTAEFMAWCGEWFGAVPDASVEELQCHGGPDWTVAMFTSRGNNTGQMGPFPATDLPLAVDMCSVARWADDRIVEEHVYFDMYGVLAQLGHVPAG